MRNKPQQPYEPTLYKKIVSEGIFLKHKFEFVMQKYKREFNSVTEKSIPQKEENLYLYAMILRKLCFLFAFCITWINSSCHSPTPKKQDEPKKENVRIFSKPEPVLENESVLPLTAESAIPFLQAYGAKNKETNVRIETPLGSFDIVLFDETPYHRANFIFLTKQGYFDNTYFHRVVPGFIIQGGNSDNLDTGQKRREIGKYLLPPDTKKGFKHHRGAVSMPSSEIENPHKLASPYEFFIVQQSPGAYHLDGNYTVFGKVVRGMDVVDAINALPTDKREWPLRNMRMRVTIVNTKP